MKRHLVNNNKSKDKIKTVYYIIINCIASAALIHPSMQCVTFSVLPIQQGITALHRYKKICFKLPIKKQIKLFHSSLRRQIKL